MATPPIPPCALVLAVAVPPLFDAELYESPIPPDAAIPLEAVRIPPPPPVARAVTCKTLDVFVLDKELVASPAEPLTPSSTPPLLPPNAS